MSQEQKVVPMKELPSSPEDLKKIFEAMKMISNSKTRGEAERDYQKETISEIAKKFNLDKKFLRNAANDYHKGTFEQKVAEQDDYEVFYEKIVAAAKSV